MQLNLLLHAFDRAMRTHEVSEAFLASIQTTPTLSTAQRLSIYHDHIMAAYLGALTSTYPATQAYLSNKHFERWAQAYIQRTPSTSANLNDYGSDFSDFLATISANHFIPKFIPDLARFERLYERCFQVDVQSFDFDKHAFMEDLQTQADAIHFQLNPAGFVWNSPYPIIALWEAADRTDQAQQIIEQIPAQPHWVTRSHGKVQFYALSEAQYTVMSAIQSGHSLIAILEAHGDAVWETLFDCINQMWVQSYHIMQGAHHEPQPTT